MVGSQAQIDSYKAEFMHHINMSPADAVHGSRNCSECAGIVHRVVPLIMARNDAQRAGSPIITPRLQASAQKDYQYLMKGVDTRVAEFEAYEEKQNPFQNVTSEPELDKIYQSAIPGVTRNAVNLILGADDPVRRYHTIVGNRQEGNAYFPQGLKLGLRQVQNYAQRKSDFATNDAVSKRWFVLSMLCQDFN